MGIRRADRRALYDKLLEAYREDPGNHMRAARLAECNRRTARKTWERGWPDEQWAIPIKELIAEEQGAARAKASAEPLQEPDQETRETLSAVTDEKTEERKAAAQQSIEVRAQESKMIAATRAALMRHLAAVSVCQPGAIALAKVYNERLLRRATSGDFDENDVATLLRKGAAAMRDVANSVVAVLQAERLVMGEPTSIVGITDFSDRSLEDAAQEISRAHRAVERAKRRGFIPSSGTTPPTNGAGDGTVH